MSEPSFSLGNFEESVLLAVKLQDGKGYGASIRQVLADATGRDISIGALYATLGRLEKKGLVTSRPGEATPERGGRPKRYFRIKGAGEKALEAAEAARKRLRLAWGREGFNPA